MPMVAQSAKRTWTILQLLEWTTDHFRTARIPNARLNAEVLLGHVLGVERIMLYAHFEQDVGEEARARFRELVRRRAAREPLQYLTGRCEFFGRPFEVTPAVMVPRQETELLVDACLARLPSGPCWAADLCTGSGVVAVTLAAERADLRVAATDSSAEAVDVARRNAAALGASDRVAFGMGDLAEPLAVLLPAGRTAVELLAANPPYVCSGVLDTLEPEVKDHEPRAALDGGPDGLDVIRRLVPAAAAALAPGGWLALEIGEGQARAVADLAAEAGTFCMDTVNTVVDAGGCERVFCVRKG
jgi:release factor glutamine methyltransferase